MPPLYVYMVSFHRAIKVGPNEHRHVYAVADSFEAALAQCRAAYPQADVYQISRQSPQGGLPVLLGGSLPLLTPQPEVTE